MLQRSCAGGVVFFGDEVLLLQNDKSEWVLPKGVVRDGASASDVALGRVKTEAGVEAELLSPAGHTNYEFYSFTRKAAVRNEIEWFVMRAKTRDTEANVSLGFQKAGFYEMPRALERVTYSQDKKLVQTAYEQYCARGQS